MRGSKKIYIYIPLPLRFPTGERKTPPQSLPPAARALPRFTTPLTTPLHASPIMQVHLPRRVRVGVVGSTTRCAAAQPKATANRPAHARTTTTTTGGQPGRPASRNNSSGRGRGGPPHRSDEEVEEAATVAAAATALGGGAVVGLGTLALIASLSLGAREPIEAFVAYFKDVVDTLGPAGYAAYAAVYFALEVLCVPAIPLTATAGALFGLGAGTAIVSVSATAAATVAFLIARYAARDRVAAWAAASPRFTAVDRAVGRNGFKVVTLLRLSPLLPLAASSYLYGLTSVDLGEYVAGSWIGMLPGTVAYVAAGAYGVELLAGGGGGGEGGGGGPQFWQIGLGLAVSAASVAYVGKLAAAALLEDEAGSED